MSLDPQVAALLTLLPPPVEVGSQTPAQLRTAYAALVATRRGEGWVPEPVGSSQDLLTDGVPCRLHRPEGVRRPPVLVYLHGGGWIVGGLDSHEGVARALCHRAGIAVLSVDYRLAPEHPYPAALQDCLTAVRWAGSQEFACVGVGGDSAGGGLAAAVALVLRAEGRPLAAQLLVYPALDAQASSPSYDQNAQGYGMSAQEMRWYWTQYAATAELGDPLLSPAAAAPDLAGLAPAVVATAGYDVLRDDGDDYARRLAAAGVPVWHRQYSGLVHGFLGAGGTVDAADVAVSEIADAVRQLLVA